jgi:aspartate kinase
METFQTHESRAFLLTGLRNHWKESKVVIVAGFQGIDRRELTTLGRGGSDTSAVALEQCWEHAIVKFIPMWMCVLLLIQDVSNTKKLNEISYEEMLELARLGAGVLHSRSVEFAKKYSIRLHVRSSFNDNEGTIVMPREEMMEKFVISGVTSKDDEAKITIRDYPRRGQAVGFHAGLVNWVT